MKYNKAKCILLAVTFACSLGACSAVPETGDAQQAEGVSGPKIELGELISFTYHPGYGDMDGAYHYQSLEKNEDGDWVIISSDRTNMEEPTVTTVCAVSPEDLSAFEKYVKDMNVADLSYRADSDEFVTDYSAWSYGFTFTDPSSADKRVRFDLDQYKQYTDEDYELLKMLDKKFAELPGEELSRIVESDGESFDTGDLYCAFIKQTDSKEEYDDLMMKLDEAGYYYAPTIEADDYSALDPQLKYVVALFVYPTEQEAEEDVARLKEAGFEDASVKNIGSYTGETCWLDLMEYDTANIGVFDEYIVFSDVPVMIPYMYSAGTFTMDVIVDRESRFSSSPNMSSAGNYKEGMTVYEWVVDSLNLKEFDPDKYAEAYSPLQNLVELSLDGELVKTIHGVFYWDV